MTDNIAAEQHYLDHYDARNYPAPLVTVDMAIFTVRDQRLEVLLVKRACFPHKGRWALPGGFVDLANDASLDDAARRKLQQKTAVDTPYLEQVLSCGNPDRDPRGWSLTVAYMALLDAEKVSLQADDSAEELAWWPLDKLAQLDLAFDHYALFDACYQRLINKALYSSLPLNLMAERFTLSELQSVYEIILATAIEKKSFRRRMLDANILIDSGELRGGSNRPAKLYQLAEHGQQHIFPRMLEGARPAAK